MKFAFLSSYAHLALDPLSNRVSGGAELQVALLSRELAVRGHEAVIVSGDIGQQDGLTLQGVRTRNGGKFQTGEMADTLKALPRVFQVLREEKPDYVLILGWTAWLFFLYLMKHLERFRLVFICGLDTEVNGEFRRENPARGMLFEYAMRKSDVRFAMTEYQEKLFKEQGMDCGFYRNLILLRAAPRTAEKTIDLLWIARCQPIKRPHLFLNLAERAPELRCRMICPCENARLWDEVANRAEILPNVEFIERVPYHEVQAQYDAAKIFVNTSRYEGWPNSFIQAGLGSTALLSLDVNPDSLFDRYALGVFARGDTRMLAEGARRMLADPEVLATMQRECERFVSELHNNSHNVDAFLAGLGQ